MADTVKSYLRTATILAMVVMETCGHVTLNDILQGAAYAQGRRPTSNTGGPLNVKVDLNIIEINRIVEKHMEIALMAHFWQWWQDERLSYNGTLLINSDGGSVTLSLLDIHKIWVPDTFFSNSKASRLHEVTVPNKLIRLWPNGTVFYSQRLTLTLYCRMNLVYFPMDTQICPIRIQSYGYGSRHITLTWRGNNPVTVPAIRLVAEYNLTKVVSRHATDLNENGPVSVALVELSFKRQLDFYLHHVYVPSLLVVVLSWGAFWIDYHSVPARISISTIMILSLFTQSSGLSNTLPPVSYTKAIDVWMTSCLAFVIAAFVEYVIVNVIARNAGPQAASEIAHRLKCSGNRVSWLQPQNPAEAVDMWARILFPLAYIIFNIVYWNTYLT